MPAGLPVIRIAVEGPVDEAVVRRLIRHVGGEPGYCYVKNGKAELEKKLQGYNNAANHSPWLVLRDLDRDAECAPLLRNRLLPQPAPFMCFRIPVRKVEAWLMGDREALASFLKVRPALVPIHPESLDDPQREMVNLARQSRKREIRQDMVPREGSGRPIGPAYPSRLIEFAEIWRPDVAAQWCDSLKRAIQCLERLVRLATEGLE